MVSAAFSKALLEVERSFLREMEANSLSTAPRMVGILRSEFLPSPVQIALRAVVGEAKALEVGKHDLHTSRWCKCGIVDVCAVVFVRVIVVMWLWFCLNHVLCSGGLVERDGFDGL